MKNINDRNTATAGCLTDEALMGKTLVRLFILIILYTVTFAFLQVKCPFRGSLGGDADIFVLRGGACPRAARI